MHLFQVFHATLLLGCLLTPTLAQLEKFDSFSDNLSKDNIRIKVSNDHEMMEQDFMEPETVLPHLEQLTTSSTTVSTLTTIFNNPDASEEVEDAITTTKPHQHIFEMLMASSRDETNFSVEPSMLISNKDVDYQEEGGGSQFYQSLKSGLAETTRGMPDDDATTPDDSENETNDYDEKNQTLTTLAPSTLPTHRKPKPKYIYKMSPEEFLKTFVEDTHLRTPVAALVDRKTNSLIKSKRLWRAALRPNTPLDIVLVSYDSAGVRDAYNLVNTNVLMAAMDSIREESNTEHISKTYESISKTAQQIPFDSAIFLSTDSIPVDKDHQKSAAMILLKKRIRLYLIWFNEHAITENDASASNGVTGTLGQLALRTGGEIIHVPNNAFGTDGDLGMITLVVRNELQSLEEFPISVDKSMDTLYIKMPANVETSTLETSNGMSVNLLDSESVESFSVNSHLSLEDDTRIAWLNVSNSTGNFRLRTNSSGEFYFVVLKAKFKPKTENYPINLQNYAFNDTYRASQRLTVARQTLNENETIELVDGLIGDEKALRQTIQSVTKIDIGIQSQLLVSPGAQVEIIYEITNLRTEPQYYNFQVQDELRYLISMQPRAFYLGPDQTGTVRVYAAVPPNAPMGSKDKITLTSQGVTQTSQAAYLTVTSTGTQDPWQPYIWYTYGSRCDGRNTPGNCAGGIWSVEVSAVDNESGMLRLQSTPKGLLIRSPFIAGTNDEVKGTFTASCCDPRVTITAYDMNKNQRTIQLDVRDIYLSEFGIATVVLGCLFFIVLIILLIILCRWCIKRKRESRDLPVYRGDSRS